LRGEIFPRGAGGGGEVEDAIHPAAEIGDAAALGGAREDVGEEGEPGVVGEGGPGAGWGEAGHGAPLQDGGVTVEEFIPFVKFELGHRPGRAAEAYRPVTTRSSESRK
jgi:hypothetical protein